MTIEDRFQRLRDAGVDIEELRANGEAAVRAATPMNWDALLVRSPWSEWECPVPACGCEITPENIGMAVLTKRLERPRTLLFVLAVVCEDCAEDSDRLNILSVLTFQ
jgi:hypothetical protein